ncbi:MAG TPA: flagellar hook-associated protein FlgL [Gaiellales bacterium]|nr:flagellar hook-associated protein FlgL [Gaiellales bacterium]
MTARITQGMLNQTLLYDLRNVTTQLSTSEQQLSSGYKLNQPSDDPYGASQALKLRADLASNQQYQSNVQDANSWQNVADTALGDIGDAIQRARDLVLQGANDTNDSGDRQAIVTELNQLIDSIKTDGNTQYAGRYIFSGTKTNTQPYQLGANDAYSGDTAMITREIGVGVQVAINQPGASIIGDGTGGLLATLRGIVTDLQSGNTNALSTNDLNALDSANDQLLNARAQVGALSNRLTTASNRLQSTEQSTTQLLSNVQDADMTQVMINFSTQQAAYQAALRAGAQIIQPSLMDFLST